MKWIREYDTYEDTSDFEQIPSGELDSTNALPPSDKDIADISKAVYPSEIKIDPKTHLIKLGWTIPDEGEPSYFGYAYQKADEWFYVFFAGDPGKIIAYKCDQIQGIVHCLNQWMFKSSDGDCMRSNMSFSRWNGRRPLPKTL